MRRLITTLLLLTSIVVAHAAEPSISKEVVRKAIAGFRAADPFSEDARAYGAVVMKFVDKAPDVKVTITRDAVPFLGSKAVPQAEAAILLAAYGVGSVDFQLSQGTDKGAAYAGDLEVIRTYRAMQKRRARLRLAEVESLIDQEKRGQLKQHLTAP